jgi:cytokinin dehydrogenase
VLRTDETLLEEAGADFGHIVRRRPAAVLQPRNAAEIADFLEFARRRRLPVAARGRGHSTHGQAQAAGGVVVDLRGLAALGPVAGDRITVGAGASWHDVLTETLRHGLTPPVLTDYLGVSVGGTLSVGGIGGAAHRHGVQTDTVLDLEIVTGDGAIHTVTPDQPLGRAALAGLGQCGIITRATLRLVPAPETVHRHLICYPSIGELAAAQRRFLRAGTFDYLEGQILAGADGWQFILEGVDHTGNAVVDEPGQVTELSYRDFADRVGANEGYLRSTGEWLHPHPWWNAFLPDSRADEFAAKLIGELTPEDLGPSGLALLYPISTGRLRTPLFRVPHEPVVFLCAVLRFAPPDPITVDRMVARNREWFHRARAMGGVAYPVGSIPFSQADWRAHFGSVWPEFAEAKRRYDPANLLAPGQGVFGERSGR